MTSGTDASESTCGVTRNISVLLIIGERIAFTWNFRTTIRHYPNKLHSLLSVVGRLAQHEGCNQRAPRAVLSAKLKKT